MACYRLVRKRSAEKELRVLPREAVSRIVKLAEALREDPYPAGSRGIVGSEHTYRLRSGDYRLVYTVERERLVIEVVRVAHRREVYRLREVQRRETCLRVSLIPQKNPSPKIAACPSVMIACGESDRRV